MIERFDSVTYRSRMWQGDYRASVINMRVDGTADIAVHVGVDERLELSRIPVVEWKDLKPGACAL